jgi:hypothetical protein
MIGQEKATTVASCPRVIVVPTRVRFHVLGLTFLMAFLIYMERGAIGAASPGIVKEFRIDKITMGWSVSAFN